MDKENEKLIHGAEIFGGYIEDPNLVFINQVEEYKLSRDLFTLQFVEKSIERVFPYQKEDIMKELVRMLLFDSLVGNNDRHFYN